MPSKRKHFNVGRGCLIGVLFPLGFILLAAIIHAIVLLSQYDGFCNDISSDIHTACSLGRFIFGNTVLTTVIGLSDFWQYVLPVLFAIMLIGFLLGAFTGGKVREAARPDIGEPSEGRDR